MLSEKDVNQNLEEEEDINQNLEEEDINQNLEEEDINQNLEEEDINQNLEEEDDLTEEQKHLIVKMFESTEYEFPVIDIIEELKEHGYSNVNDIILCAIYDNILDVSSIEEDGTVYLALGLEGEDVWEDFNDNKGTCTKE